MKITPIDQPGQSRTGTLYDINVRTITEILGFGPNIQDDPDKVVSSWGFEIDGQKFGVWDYNGSQEFGQYSTYGDPAVLEKLFGVHYC